VKDLDDSKSARKSNQSFTSRKMDWLDAAQYDRRVIPSYFKIAFVIAQHINGETGKGFPSQETIADLTGLSVETVKRAIKRLVAIGYLKKRQSRGYVPTTGKWETRNVYWLRFENVQPMFDMRADAKRGRKNRNTTLSSVMGDTFTSVTGDTLTPSVKHLQKEGESSDGEGGFRERVLPLVYNGGRA
jgi:hypothetical protein